jgi:beta-galactosidase/beta-glucuronidase
MSTPHVIRLRGPWEYTVEARSSASSETTELPPTGRVTMPTDWAASLGDAFRGRVAYRRRFGKPTNLASNERVWLVCDGATARAAIELNGQSLGEVSGPSMSAEFDVTELLAERNEAERNELVAVVESVNEVGGLTGEVRLEIRKSGEG